MGAFDDLLEGYEPPREVNIVMPTKVGAPGEKGGANAQSSAATAARPSDSQSAATGPEPEPQLPEGSDPDEPDEPEEEAAEEVGAEPEPADDPVLAAAEAALKELSEDDEAEDESLGGVDEAEAPVIPRKGGGLAFEGESAYLKQFPRIMIDQMREILAVQVNDTFARDISQVSIVTAFVMASMGMEITTDEVTAHAVRAFRENDPRVDAIDKRTAAILESQTRSEGMLKRVIKRLGEQDGTLAVLELGQAYALAERTAQLDTTGALPENLDVTQKRVVATRDNIRGRVAVQRNDEKIRNGRPIR